MPSSSERSPFQRLQSDLIQRRIAWIEFDAPYGDEPMAQLKVTLKNGVTYSLEVLNSWLRTQHQLWSNYDIVVLPHRSVDWRSQLKHRGFQIGRNALLAFLLFTFCPGGLTSIWLSGIENSRPNTPLGELVTRGARSAWHQSSAEVELKILQETTKNDGRIQEQVKELRELYTVLPENNPLRLEHLFGNPKLKQELQDFIQELKNPEQFQKYGLELPSGILLTGRPGNGKTLLARALAGEAGLPLVAVPGSYFNCILSGSGELRIQALFRLAESMAPAIVFIDELDCFASDRDEQRANVVRSAFNQLLVEMDGFHEEKGKKPILLMAATNLPDTLDPAVKRAGRFNHTLAVSDPNRQERLQFIQDQIQKRSMPLEEGLDMGLLSRYSKGLTFSQLEGWVNEAAIQAFERQADKVSIHDFHQAYAHIQFGHYPPCTLTEASRDRLAWQVAAETLVGYKLKPVGRPYLATLQRWKKYPGLVLFDEEKGENEFFLSGPKNWQNYFTQLVAHRVVHKLLEPKSSTQYGSENEIERMAKAKFLALRFIQAQMDDPSLLVGSMNNLKLGEQGYQPLVRALQKIPSHLRADIEARLDTLIEEAQERARALLQENRATWKKLHDALLTHPQLSGEALEACWLSQG